MLYGENEGSFRDLFMGLEKLISGETKPELNIQENSNEPYRLKISSAYQE